MNRLFRWPLSSTSSRLRRWTRSCWPIASAAATTMPRVCWWVASTGPDISRTPMIRPPSSWIGAPEQVQGCSFRQ